MIIAIDPANITGVAWEGGVESYNFTPKKGTKKRSSEPEYLRFGKLWDVLNELRTKYVIEVIVCENATGFSRGKNAIVVSNQYRGVVKAFCAIHGIQYVGVEPGDLKEFATGKRGAEKEEVIAAANALGYVGNDDNQADAFMLLQWAKSQGYISYMKKPKSNEEIDDCPFGN
jgi:Holliday junction resolvasome RuvABC endonuclease subunit